MIPEGPIELDFVWRQAFILFGQEVQGTHEISNLQNEEFREFFGAPDGSSIDALSYDRGRSFSLGLSTTF